MVVEIVLFCSAVVVLYVLFFMGFKPDKFKKLTEKIKGFFNISKLFKKFNKKEKQKDTSKTETSKKESSPKQESKEPPKEKQEEFVPLNKNSSEPVSLYDFDGDAEKEAQTPNVIKEEPNIKPNNFPPKNIFIPKQKTLAEKIRELPPELKILIVDNVLDKKDEFK